MDAQVTKLTLAAGLTVLAAFVLSSCEDTPPLVVSSVEPAGRAAARNEPIVVRFSADIDPETPVDALVTVLDGSDRIVETTAAHGGRTVVLRPTDPWGWPGRSDLRVRVRPGRAVGFRAVSGEELETESLHTLSTSTTYVDHGTPMVLESAPPEGLRGIGKDAVFHFEFSLPIDRECLHRRLPAVALRYRDRQGRWFPTLVRDLSLSEDGRTLFVRPWAADSAFAVASEHELIIHDRRLRAVTGRGLGRTERLTFWTSHYEDDGRFLDVEFSTNDLEGTPPSDAPRARPVRDRVNSVTLDFDRLRGGWVRELWDASDQVRQFAVMPLSREPGRFQMLIPGDALSETPGLIESLAFYAPLGVDRNLLFPRLRIRIGYADDDAADLSPVFDRNLVPASDLDPQSVLETVPAGSTGGELVLKGAARDTWLEIPLERPFRYVGGRRTVLVEILNDLGCVPAEPEDTLPNDFRGVPLCCGPQAVTPGFQHQTTVFANTSAGADVGLTTPLVFSTKIRIERYIEVMSDWYEADAAEPVWFIVRTADYLDADGAENEGFLFDYQGVAPDGRLLPWGRLDRLHGCRKIRARLRFLPVESRTRAIRPEVRRLRIRYKDAAAR